MTGIELIAQERKEQIEKHGWDLKRDQDYGHGELLMAANFCLNPEQELEWPWHDGPKGPGTYFFKKIKAKSRIDQLKVAGAFIAAEIDRLQNLAI